LLHQTGSQTSVWGYFMHDICSSNTEMRTTFFLILLHLCVTKANAAGDTLLSLNYNNNPVQVKLLQPEGIKKGSVLLLHGWNLPFAQWCEKTAICSLALNKGYTVVIPDFGKTTYHWETYPETILKYRVYPTRKWMYDTLLPALQNGCGVLIPGKNNFVAGLSTGGRGAALFALEHPDIFKGAACLSADFDQRLLKNEPINTGYYGPQEKFPERWAGRDNIYLRSSEFKCPLLIIHGKNDRMCPYTQSTLFEKEMKAKNPDLICRLKIDERGDHNYALWGKYTTTVLSFFDELCR
jgi:pimeloyl-ACP methyl ester carboxylesterase